MSERRKEFLVGCLVLLVFLLMGVFAWLMGVFRPFSDSVQYHLLYSFAGGVDEGSAVRVAGVKVGKVDRIEFLSESGKDKEDPVALKVTIRVSKRAAASVRKDSRFFVNMAGVIGERYVEISPGTLQAERLEPGATVRGVDPPRVDQLLSQGFGAFGKLQKFLEENDEVVTQFLNDLSKMLKRNDLRKFFKLVENVNELTSDIRVVTKKLHQPTGQEVINKLYELIGRAHEVDKEALKQFYKKKESELGFSNQSFTGGHMRKQLKKIVFVGIMMISSIGFAMDNISLEELRMQKRFGFGFSAAGPLSLLGIEFDINVSEEWSVSGGMGTGLDYSTMMVKARYFLIGKHVSPYVGVGMSRWWSQGTNEKNLSPSILTKKFIKKGTDLSKGFNLLLAYPVLGVQFMHPNGLSVFAEVQYLVKLFTLANGAYAGLGMHWYF